MALQPKGAGQAARTAEWDALKGFLILCVMFGHMHVVQNDMRPVYDLIYIFHVAGFLIIPFFMPTPSLSWSFLKTRFVRYGVPFFLFFTASSILFYFAFLSKTGVSVPNALWRYGLGLATASSQTLDDASGLKLFWFLPALFSLVTLRALWAHLQKTGRAVLLAMCLAVNMSIGEMGNWRYLVPCGLLIAGFIFPLGLAVSIWIQGVWARKSTTEYGVIMALAVLLLAACWQTHISINLGDLTLYGVLSNPFHLVLYEVTLMASVGALVLAMPLLVRIPGLALAGRLSLPIYLTHGLVNHMLEITVMRPLHLGTGPSAVLLLTLNVLIAGGIAWGMMHIPRVRAFCFPRDGKEWVSSILYTKKLA